MGRTLTSVLLVAGTVGLAAVLSPFVSGAIVGIGGGTFGAAGVAASLAPALSLAAGALVTSTAVGLLGLGPSLGKPDTAVAAIKTSRPPRVAAYGRSRLYGAYVLFETASNGTAVDVYAVADGKADAIEAYYLGDETVTLTDNVVNEGADGRYRDGAVNFYTTDGSSPGTPFAAIITLLPGILTSNHRGDGVVMMALTAASVKAKVFQETYPQSSVPVPSIVGRWQKCPDPSADDPTDESEWTWTENPVRHLLHYKLVREKVDYANRIAPAIESWIAASADCDDATALKAGGTEARYRSCLAHKLTDANKDVTGAILSTFDGWIAPRPDGALQIYSGRYYAPTVSIGSDEIVSYQWDGLAVDDDRAINEIIVGYTSSEHDFNVVEGEAWQDEDDIAARGQILSQPLDVQVPSFPQARRLAKRKMRRAMAVNRGTITTNVAGRTVRGERYINLRIEEGGVIFFDGPAEITALTRNMATGGVTFSWVAADPDIDEWNPATEEGESASVGDRVAPEPLTAPVIANVAVIAGPRLQITITGPDREDLTWFGHTRIVGATIWGTDLQYSEVASGASIVIVTDIVPNAQNIEVQVAYVVGDGRQSAWSSTASANAIDTGTAPGLLASGARFSGPGSVPLPAAYQISQPLLLIVETANEAVSAPTGWTQLASSPQGTGTAGGTSATRVTVFWKRAADGETAPSVINPGDHIASRIIALTRVSSLANPFNVQTGATAASSATVSFPTVTTTVNNCLIIGIVAWATDSATEQLSAPVNAALSGLSISGGPRSTDGNGGGATLVLGVRALAGATGSTTATLAAASVQGLVTIAVAPA